MENTWEIVHDCDSEDGAITCWSKEINHTQYGKFIWITKNANCSFDVEVNQNGDFRTFVTCKSLVRAKRCGSINISENL